MTEDHSLLLSPTRIGPIEVRNRVVSTAHGAFLDFYRPGEPGERYIAYQERRAAGGAGLIILQPIHVHHTSQAAGHYVYDPDDIAPKFAEMARRLHAYGTRVLVQLLHFGAAFTSDTSADLEPLWSFSPFVSPTGAEAAHAMTPDEIEEVIDGYARTAQLAVESGLDGVEVQAAHGYLVQQSMSPWANQRTDEWGQRDRFVTEVLDRVRSRVGPDGVVGIRLSVDDWVRPENGGLGPDAVREIARGLVRQGRVDLVNVSAGARAAHYARSIGSYRYPEAPLLPLTGELREAIGAAVPVIGVSRIMTPQRAEAALREHQCDLVGMTRAQITDPDLVRKTAEGRTDTIRPCVSANQGCVDRQQGALPITCFHNPDVGREHLLAREGRVATPGRVLVVGAGPAGLKAAAAAARRGHEVRLVERAGDLGGRLRLVEGCGPAAELLRSVDWLRDELRRLDVEVSRGVEVDADSLLASDADAVVLATGSVPAPDRLALGDGSVPVVSVDDALRVDHEDRRVLVVDQQGSLEVALTAECVAGSAESVHVISPMQSVGARIGFTMVKDQLIRLHRAGCVLEPSTAYVTVSGGTVTTRHVHSGRRQSQEFDLVVAGVPGRPDLRLYDDAVRAVGQVLLAGDVVAPRTAMHAFREGDDAGRSVRRVPAVAE